MTTKLKSLIWLRTQQLATNGQYLILVFMPYFFVMLYKVIFSDGIDNNFLIFTCLPMIFGLSMGTLVTSVIAEEKEKNNLRVLSLSGISGIDYIISALFYPSLMGIVGILLMPVVVGGMTINYSYASYVVVSLITAIVVALINLLISMYVSSLNQAQIVSLPIMMITIFLPMFSVINETVKALNQYTYMGSFTHLFSESNGPIFMSTSFYCLLLWLVGLLVLNGMAYRSKLHFKGVRSK